MSLASDLTDDLYEKQYARAFKALARIEGRKSQYIKPVSFRKCAYIHAEKIIQAIVDWGDGFSPKRYAKAHNFSAAYGNNLTRELKKMGLIESVGKNGNAHVYRATGEGLKLLKAQKGAAQ